MKLSPKEKAIGLVSIYSEQIGCSALNTVTDAHDLDEETLQLAKECALICIERDIYFFNDHKYEWNCWEEEYEELLEVKQEIEKL